ncbi:TspO/MBR family protein [Edaphobacter dinghuensis]|uniref:TspO/MBR-related protein n=1 Tax=Edaphobacter dinghuensis TaxID=1560005 RepID=A0A917H3W6_9BACT|nr:TspO/MBR family protein [Edaphobacter dinghuensis]GGG66656.1 putative TspO/MBR-related protein precursor [Edaphobacter dinghuensis]
MKSWQALTLLLAVCYAVAGAGHLFMASIPAELRKHGFAPANHLLVPAWIVLYSCMALAAWLIWRRPESRLRSRALALFSIQLILNFMWMMDFFYYQVVGPSLFILLVLWATVLLTTVLFWRLRHLTAYLLAPYLAWLAFAFSLNFDIFSLG